VQAREEFLLEALEPAEREVLDGAITKLQQRAMLLADSG
jgi:hypothetical protein